jgi:acyl dehydratase
MARLHFEDFAPGDSAVYGPVTVSKDDIVAFAREFDPQPFHLDEEGAKHSFVGRLIGSGWHSCALLMRLIADGFLRESTALGAPGIEETRWLRPVLPGDRLRVRYTVLETRESKSRPEIGFVRFRFALVNEVEKVVLEQTNWIMFARRGAGPVPALSPHPPGPARAPGMHLPDIDFASRPIASPYLDDLVVGEEQELGSFTFSAEDIVRYARAYDPQPFHLDPEAAKKSLFGGLCASGWHTGAVWMKLMVAHRERVNAEARRRGERPARLGPSPGFKNLKWLKPVYAGDTVTFRSTTTGTRASATRPGWGLAFHHHKGFNQHNEEVFSYDGAVFWERRSGAQAERQAAGA